MYYLIKYVNLKIVFYKYTVYFLNINLEKLEKLLHCIM